MTEHAAAVTYLPGWGGRLAQARKRLGKTQADLGAALGVRNTAVSKWEGELVAEMDERSLTALEYLLGIRRDWILKGEQPILASTWSREAVRGILDQLASARVDGVWAVPPHSGMAPLFGAGEVVFWTEAFEPTQGAIILAAPPGGPGYEPGLAPQGTRIGQAFRTESTGEWLLYRLEDRDRPGSYPAIPLAPLTVFGKVVARAVPVVDATAMALQA